MNDPMLLNSNYDHDSPPFGDTLPPSLHAV